MFQGSSDLSGRVPEGGAGVNDVVCPTPLMAPVRGCVPEALFGPLTVPAAFSHAGVLGGIVLCVATVPVGQSLDDAAIDLIGFLAASC